MLGGEHAIPYRILLIFLPLITIGVPVATVLGDHNSPFWKWTIAALFGSVIAAGATFLLDITILSQRQIRPIPNNWLFALGFFLGWIKGFATGFAAIYILKIPEISVNDELKRAFTSAALGTFFIPAISYLSYSSWRLLHSKEFANSRLANLNEIRTSDQKIIEDVQIRLLSIKKEFQALAVNPFENKREKLADSIEEMARNVIRPMSHEFAKKRRRENYNFKFLLSEGLRLDPITMSLALPWVVVMFLAFQGAFFFNHSTISGAIALTLYDFLILLKLLKLMIKFYARFKMNQKLNFISSLIFLAILPIVQTLPLNFLGKDISWAKFSATYILLIIIFYVSQISNTHNLSEEKGIDITNQQYMEEFDLVLRNSNNEINDEIVRFLHGTLQTKLSASAFRFRDLNDSSFDVDQEIRNVITHFEIEKEISKVVIGESLTERLEVVLEEWQPLLEIEPITLELNESSLSRSQACRICDFINECLSNALRHGHATRVRIQVSEALNDVLVVVSNNGSPVAQTKKGLGTKIFDQVSHSRWDIKNKADGSGVRVSALFSR